MPEALCRSTSLASKSLACTTSTVTVDGGPVYAMRLPGKLGCDVSATVTRRELDDMDDEGHLQRRRADRERGARACARAARAALGSMRLLSCSDGPPRARSVRFFRGRPPEPCALRVQRLAVTRSVFRVGRR